MDGNLVSILTNRYRLTKARTHGAQRILEDRAASAQAAAIYAEIEGEGYFAASLRGKAKGLREAATLIAALENDRRLPRRRTRDDEPAQ